MSVYDVQRYKNYTTLVDKTIDTLAFLSEFNQDRHTAVGIICKSAMAEIVFRFFSKYVYEGLYFDYGFVEFDLEYKHEYMISITNQGFLHMEKLFDDNVLLIKDMDIVFVSDKCNSKILSRYLSYKNNIYCFSIG